MFIKVSTRCALNNPCENHGICSDNGADVTCDCVEGWTGADCSEPVDACESHQCDHGTCVDHQFYYTCTCDSHYWGRLCNRKYKTPSDTLDHAVLQNETFH